MRRHGATTASGRSPAGDRRPLERLEHITTGLGARPSCYGDIVLGKAMTTRGRQTAALFGVLVAIALPKQVPCEIPGDTCEVIRDHRACQPTDVEPLGVYAIEWILHRDLPIAYSHRVQCP